MIEVGKWYEWQGWPESQEGKPFFVFAVDREYEVDVVSIRSPSGMERETFPDHLRGPIDPVPPGVYEPCGVCEGTKMVRHYEHDERLPHRRNEVGRKPCPNCHELLPAPKRPERVSAPEADAHAAPVPDPLDPPGGC